MRMLITGGTGFIGHYLAALEIKKGNEVLCTHYDGGSGPQLESVQGARYEKLDITSSSQVHELLRSFTPDVVFHLAGQAYPVPSWKDPEWTFKVNVLGTIYLFEGMRRFCPDASSVVACSGAEYGDRVVSPIMEESVLKPLSPYGVSKATQDMLVYQYYRSYGMKLFSLRLFGTTGPGKTGDAANDFARQIAAAEKSGGVVHVGDLSPVRDISDVRDVVKAFDIAYSKASPGEAYNVGSGKHYAVGELLQMLLSFANPRPEYHVDEKLFRPADEQVIFPSVEKISKLGYAPSYSIRQTLRDILEYWRKQIH